MGLCPLHTDHKPSFLVDHNKNLFYCYGCGRGDDVIRFAELFHQVNFPQAPMLLQQWCLAPLLNTVIDFYRLQLQRYNEVAAMYLDQRGVHSSELDRAHAHRLRARPLFAKLAPAIGLSALGSATSRAGQCCWLRRLHPRHRFSIGK
jgi:hypothetical protein